MKGFQDTGRVRRPFGDIEIELRPATVDAAVRDASLREFRHLVSDFKYRQPRARQILLEVYATMRGLSANTAQRDTSELDAGSPRADAIGQEILTAAYAGTIIARRREVRSVVIPLDTPSEAVLGPDSSQDVAADTKSWVGLTLVDQTGTPVPNRPYRVIKPDGTTVDGMLDSNGAAMLQGLDPGNCQIWCPYVEPHPPTTYTVQDGDHVSGVAQTFGFDDYAVVWNDPGNADLQSQRTDPHVVQQGDQLAIPEVKAQPAANKPTGAKHPRRAGRPRCGTCTRPRSRPRSSYIYIENQYFTSIELANLVKAAIPSLNHVTLLLQGSSDIDDDGGIARTKKCLDILRSADPDKKKFRAFVRVPSQGATHHYVHSKLMIVDDQYAVIGTANGARRSFDFDSEVAIGVFDRIPKDKTIASFARRHRMRLWSENLDGNTGQDFLNLADGRAAAFWWDAIATVGMGNASGQGWKLYTWEQYLSTASAGTPCADWEWDQIRDPIPPGPT